MGSLLFGVTPTDPVTFIVVPLGLSWSRWPPVMFRRGAPREWTRSPRCERTTAGRAIALRAASKALTAECRAAE